MAHFPDTFQRYMFLENDQDTTRSDAWASLPLNPPAWEDLFSRTGHGTLDIQPHYVQPSAGLMPMPSATPLAIDEENNAHQPWSPLSPWVPYSVFQIPGGRSDTATAPKRKHPCLGCDKKGCFGYPLCRRCAQLPGPKIAPFTIAESAVNSLNYQEWFWCCWELCRQPTAPEGEQNSVLESEITYRSIVLELDFNDLQVQRDACNTSTFRCDLPLERTTDPAFGGGELPETPPRINSELFDAFILKAMW